MYQVHSFISNYISLRKRGSRSILYGLCLFSVLLLLSSILFVFSVSSIAQLTGLVNLETATAGPNTIQFTSVILKIATQLFSTFVSMLIFSGVAYGSVDFFQGKKYTKKETITRAISFAVSKRGFTLAITYSIASIAAVLGFIFFLIPGFILISICSIAFIAAIDQNCSYSEGCSIAYSIVRNNLAKSIFCPIFIGLFTVVSGLCTLGTGFFIAPVLQTLGWATFYYLATNKSPLFNQLQENQQ